MGRAACACPCSAATAAGGADAGACACRRVTIENPCRPGEVAEVLLGVDDCGNLVVCVKRDWSRERPSRPPRPARRGRRQAAPAAPRPPAAADVEGQAVRKLEIIGAGIAKHGRCTGHLA